MTKEGITSQDLQKSLAHIFKIKLRDVGLAGMKDKESVSTQTFSLLLKEDVDNVTRRIKSDLNIKVNWAKRHKNKLKVGHLLGNKFKIIIADLDFPTKETLKRTKKIIAFLEEKGIPNFYGEQRFGFKGDNFLVGKEIILGRKRVKNKWLRRFLISSYQSYLCNLYLSKRIEYGYFDKILKGDICKKYETGGMFEVDDPEKEQERYQKKEITFTAPLYGSKMWETKSESKKLEREILEDENISVENLKSAKVEGTRRAGRIFLKDFKLREHSKGIKMEFFLPKGSFATTVLREIMKKD